VSNPKPVAAITPRSYRDNREPGSPPGKPEIRPIDRQTADEHQAHTVWNGVLKQQPGGEDLIEWADQLRGAAHAT
jgi:hypothetical protein